MEEAALRRTLELLRQRDGQATGQLHRDVKEQFPSVERRTFEDLLGGLSRAGSIRIEDDAFEKDGETIRFRRAFLTGTGSRADAAIPAAAARIPSTRAPLAKPRRGERPQRRETWEEDDGDLDPLVTALRRWRLEEAKKGRVPTFRILADQTLLGIAARRPATEEELLAVGGLGPSRLGKYGERLLAIVRSLGRGVRGPRS
jgi:DNA topoisomerase-3